MVSNMLKKLIVGIMLVSSTPLVKSKGIYVIPELFGSMTDWLYSRSDLSEKYEKMFQEIAKKYNIEDREIKAKNMGIIFRLYLGYQNALAVQQTNRVYFNEDFLQQLTDEQVAYLMAHELAHHSNHHTLKKIGGSIGIGLIQTAVVASALQSAFIKKNADNPLLQYFTCGLAAGQFSFWTLLNAQMEQRFETEADTHAITQVGLNPEDGIALFDELYHPTTDNWPLYAKINAFVESLLYPVLELPVIKQHMPHLVCHKDRVTHIASLKKSKDTDSQVCVDCHN